MDPRDKTSNSVAGIAAYRHDMLQRYSSCKVLLVSSYILTRTSTEDGLLAGYKADSMLKLFSDFAKLLYSCS